MSQLFGGFGGQELLESRGGGVALPEEPRKRRGALMNALWPFFYDGHRRFKVMYHGLYHACI